VPETQVKAEAEKVIKQQRELEDAKDAAARRNP
jgi:hypothetical protein